MKVEIEFDEKTLQAEAIKTTILKSAVENLLANLTPESIAIFVEKTLAESIKSITSWDLSNAVRPHATKLVNEYVATPEVQDRMKKAFHGAIDAALGTMPDLIKAEVASAAAEAFKRTLLDKIGHR